MVAISTYNIPHRNSFGFLLVICQTSDFTEGVAGDETKWSNIKKKKKNIIHTCTSIAVTFLQLNLAVIPVTLALVSVM